MTSRVIKGNGEDLTDPTLLEVTSGRLVIPAELVSAKEEAVELVEKARQEAARIRRQAEEILEEAVQEKEELRQEGVEEGFQEGLARVTERLTAVETEREKILFGQEREIVEIVEEIAKKVVQRELDHGAIVDIVRQALKKAVGERVVLRLHPADKARLSKKEDFSDVLGSSATLKIEEDETLTAGGCVVETELGTVDARVEPQWEAIRRALGLKGK